MISPLTFLGMKAQQRYLAQLNNTLGKDEVQRQQFQMIYEAARREHGHAKGHSHGAGTDHMVLSKATAANHIQRGDTGEFIAWFHRLNARLRVLIMREGGTTKSALKAKEILEDWHTAMAAYMQGISLEEAAAHRANPPVESPGSLPDCNTPGHGSGILEALGIPREGLRERLLK